MRGSASVLRRMTTAVLALGFLFGLPNVVHAQTPQLQPTRLPWQTASFSTNTASFDKHWTRVLSDIQRQMRRFDAPYPYHQVLSVNPTTQTQALDPLVVAQIPVYVAPVPKPAEIKVGSLRTTLSPVEFGTNVAAESRPMHGVLTGLRVEFVD